MAGNLTYVEKHFMNTIKGYMVRMWTSDKDIHSQKFFSAENMLTARREAFEYANNLLDIMAVQY